jgi:hypothetical protein
MKPFLFPALVTTLLGVAGLSGHTLINDNFNDGSLTTNTGGTGHGFVLAPANQVSLTESGGVVSFTAGGGVQQIASNASDALNPFQSSATTLTVTFGQFGFTPNFDRQWVGYVTTGGTHFYFPSPAFTLDQGIYLSAAYDNPSEDGNFGNASPHRGNLVTVSNAGAITTLASWDWTSQPGTGFAVSLTTTATTYSMSFSGGTVSSFATGAASGTLSGLGTISANFDAFVYGQSGGGAGGFTLDALSVVAVPEPSTCAVALGACALAGVAWRRGRWKAQRSPVAS